jgi:membrane-associated phospholipid phosphatase
MTSREASTSTLAKCAIGHWSRTALVVALTSGTAYAQAGSDPPIAASMRTAVAVVLSADPPAEGNVATRLIRDVARDYKNFLSIETVVWLGAGGGAAAAVHAADDSIADWAQRENLDLPGGNLYGSQLFQVPVAIAWWMIGSAADSDRNAATGRDLLRAQLQAVSWTYAIKFATNRTRPNGDPHSFPSGHASTSFATAIVLQEHFGWKAGLPAFAAATYTAFTRVAANQHWASDVVFGAAVGLASGRTATLRLRDTKVSFAPLAVPGGGGVLVNVGTHP